MVWALVVATVLFVGYESGQHTRLALDVNDRGQLAKSLAKVQVFRGLMQGT